MPRQILPALAAAVLALGAAACGHGGDGPVTTPPPALGSDASDGGGSDPDPSDGGGAETEEPTAAAPDIPAPDPADYPGMDAETPEGAEQALRYYIAERLLRAFRGLFVHSGATGAVWCGAGLARVHV